MFSVSLVSINYLTFIIRLRFVWKELVLKAQVNEITEYVVYSKLSRSVKDINNSTILSRIAEDELKHYGILRGYSGVDVKPNFWRIAFYIFLAKVFGLTFALKIMERIEGEAVKVYISLSHSIPGLYEILRDEENHERELLGLIDEERLKYIGSMILGLNDALVELTGALAGLTMTLQDTRLIGIIGFITGFAAALSMAASEYLSSKAEGGNVNPVKASMYTGVMYLFTVLILIFPYLFSSNIYVCLGLMIFNATLIITVFTFYTSIVKESSFKRRFLEMMTISLSVALLSFTIGFLVRSVFGFEV